MTARPLGAPVLRWTYTGAPPTREASAWVYGLNWADSAGAAMVIHVLGGPLVLALGDTLVRSADGTCSVEALLRTS